MSVLFRLRLLSPISLSRASSSVDTNACAVKIRKMMQPRIKSLTLWTDLKEIHICSSHSGDYILDIRMSRDSLGFVHVPVNPSCFAHSLAKRLTKSIYFICSCNLRKIAAFQMGRLNRHSDLPSLLLMTQCCWF